jgi:hypothetical protein
VGDIENLGTQLNNVSSVDEKGIRKPKPMGSIAIAMPAGVGRVSLSDVLRLVGLPSETERAAKKIGSGEELIRIIVAVIDDLVLRAVEKRSAEEFRRAREEVFPQYFEAMRAFGSLIRIVVPQHAMDRLISESLSELEADFRDLGPAAFGSDMANRGTFTVWTLRKIKDLAEEIGNLGPPPGHKTDSEMAMKFAAYAVLSRFHVDCLVRSMRTGKPIYPEIREQIANGLRAAVDAYAWIRQAIDLRSPAQEPEIIIPWEEEDDYLLADSMNSLVESR